MLTLNFLPPHKTSVWHTEDALKSFQATPACAEFLRGLPETADVLPSSSVTSAGASLQDLSLDSASVTSAPPPPPPPSSSSSSRFLIFQWHSPYRFEENLKGRITLTALELPCTTGTGTGTGDAAVPEEWRKAVHDAVDGFMPRGCEDIRSAWNARMQFWTAWAWADDDLTHLRRRAAMTKGAVEEGGEEQGKANTSARRAFMCQFRRWNGYSNATPERESAAAASELARESWARRVATVMPPVTDWEQERWDIQVVPRYEPPLPERCGDPEEEDPEYERKMREFFDEDSGEEEDK